MGSMDIHTYALPHLKHTFILTDTPIHTIHITHSLGYTRALQGILTHTNTPIHTPPYGQDLLDRSLPALG